MNKPTAMAKLFDLVSY